MRVAVYRGPGMPVSIEQVADPTPASDEVVLRICRCGICGSDIFMTSGGPFDYPLGFRLGHEYAGEVVALGRDVSRLRVGDRVACLPGPGCGKCLACREGRPLSCSAQRAAMGGFADYIAIAQHGAVLLPQSLSFADGALVEPMACGRRALRMAGFAPGERLLILGAGAMALSLVYWARLQGACSIIVASRSSHRREAILAMGADLFFGEDEDDPADLQQALAVQPDTVAECVGTPGMIGKAIERVRNGGTVISIGMCGTTEPIIPALCTFKELRLVFPLGYSIADFEETVRSFDAGRLDPALMVSETVPLDALPAAFERLRSGAKSLKILVDPRSEFDHG